MEIKYEWKTTLFSSKFEIYRDNILVGELGKGNWKRKVPASLNNRKIVFGLNGLFWHDAVIIDPDNSVPAGTIKFSGWKSKASVSCHNSQYDWQYDSFFRTKWSLGNPDGVLIRFLSGSLKGTIISNTNDEILILSGFFIRNIFRQRSAGVGAA